MKELALHLGSAACKGVDRFEIASAVTCADSSGTMLLGYTLLLAVATVIAGLATAKA